MSTPPVPRQPATSPGQSAVPPQYTAPQQPAAAPHQPSAGMQPSAVPQPSVPPTVRRPVADSPWASHRPAGTERATSRLRRVVEGLPDWEPLPPGEMLVRRPGSDR
ncbi:MULTISPECIES: hypothetical protein [Streptomyces]|uniref:Uncharacterized protein n=1 Tax=Streptomyces venezuelae TaxID=54571 RepID=A0A5P2APK7_STRVZ|nr:hypothetical protein [Streptomyces venezuelae]QES18791.1 hypothetical protein DEJ46_06575 [Streptomyces venezuelae]